MTAKRYKTRVPFGSTLDINVHKELKKYSDETDIPISKILDKAILQYLSHIKRKN